MYSNSCCRCSFEAEIIKIGQSSHKMYSNNLVNFQESTTILSVYTKKVWKLIECTTYIYIYIYFYFPSISPSQNLPPPRISLFFTEIYPSLPAKSLMKLDTLDDAQPWPSVQIATVPFFPFLSLKTLPSFYIFIIILSISSIAEN